VRNLGLLQLRLDRLGTTDHYDTQDDDEKNGESHWKFSGAHKRASAPVRVNLNYGETVVVGFWILKS